MGPRRSGGCFDAPAGSCSQANGSHLVGVPAGAGQGDHRVRLLLRRVGLAPTALRPGVHRAAHPTRVRHRLDGPPGFGLGQPAGQEPVHGPRRSPTACSIPDPRPGLQVLQPIRRGLPLGRDRGDPHTPIRAPNANAFAERWIRTVRAECLDWTLILGRRHLDRVLRTYAEHYNGHRAHRALGLAAPLDGSEDSLPIRPWEVHRRNVLGGLIHEYHGMAA